MNTHMRREYAVTLKMALESCLPDNAETVVCAWLAERRQTGPIPYLIDLDAEAAIWAAAASPADLLAYMGAIITEMALTKIHPNIRKQMTVWLWHGFDERTRAAFLRKFGT
jgi:hypothetical protein